MISLLERGILWPSSIVLVSFLYRMVNSFLVQTWFEADEFWQSLEPAHRLTFGYGYLTWEWQHGLRSYSICDLIYPNSVGLLVFAPKLFQCLLGALSDIYYFSLLQLFFSHYVALLTIACYWLNWFQFFCTPRTLANTVEMQLLIIGLYYYPWSNQIVSNHLAVRWRPSVSTYLIIATMSTLIRPTAAIIWLPLIIRHFWGTTNKVSVVCDSIFLTALPVLTIGVLIDRLCYGRWVFSLWNFFVFNFLSGGSVHFGVNPWHWYFTNGLPAVLLTHSIPVFLGIYRSNVRWIFLISLWYICIHSFIPHKELRFVLPLVPLLNIYAGLFMASDSNLSMGLKNSRNLKLYWLCTSKRIKALLSFLFVTNFPLIIYTCLFHQRGVLDVVSYLHELAVKNEIESVWFLTPCHSTPFYSHMHAQVPARFLSCEPHLNRTNKVMDEADFFYNDPKKWLETELGNEHVQIRPSHLVVYEKLWNILKSSFVEYGYRKCARFFNTHFPVSNRQSPYLLLLCKKYH